MLARLDRAAYRAQHLAFFVPSLVMQQAARRLTRQPPPSYGPEVVRLLRRRYFELLERDLTNVEAGLYPRALLFQMPVAEYARKLPVLLRDAPGVWRRKRANEYRDLPGGVDTSRYPPYYRRTFHWQTDGYFSQRSAELYDLGVELLFLGTADVMRRQIIPPVTRFLQGRDRGGARLLDIACGTGRALLQLAAAHPGLRLCGVDLSPYYVQAARKRLAHVPDASLVIENAEDLPFIDSYFDVVTSVYLFHELPRRARRNVLVEAYRVLRPGGLLVVEDSAQPSDSPEIAELLGDFSREFHEPFYADYLRDDLSTLLEETGFEVKSAQPHMVAKVVTAHKPPH